MDDLSKKKCMVYGYGLFEVFIAQHLAEDFGKVMVFTPNWSAFPLPEQDMIGEGIPGIERTSFYEDSKAEVIESGGLFVFPDVGDGDKQRELRRMAAEGGGKFRVFGTGDSEELELSRLHFKQTLKKAGLPVPKYKMVYGIDELIELLKVTEDVYIKLDTKYRGLLETFHHETWAMSADVIYKFAHDLGGLRDIIEIMVEWPLKGVEPGGDWFVSGGLLLPKGLYGWENKGDGYSCKVVDTDKVDKSVREVNEKMGPVVEKYRINGAISTEVRVGADGKPYYIDACMRMGNPPAACIMSIYKYPARIMWQVAGGEDPTTIDMSTYAKYASEISVDSGDAPNEWIPFEMGRNDWKRIKLRRACMVDGVYYNLPFKDSTTVVKAVGLGDSRKEAEQEALKAAAGFKCKGVTYNKSTFDELDESMNEGLKYGVEKV